MKFNTIEEAVEDIRQGKIIVVVDDEVGDQCLPSGGRWSTIPSSWEHAAGRWIT